MQKQQQEGHGCNVSTVQLNYARLLRCGSTLGIIFLSISFFLYVTGIMPSYIPAGQVQEYWALSSSEFVEVWEIPTGWAWLTLIGRADFLSLLGIAFLAGLTIVGYLAFLLPTFICQRDMPYTIIAAAEVVLLLMVAAGVLAFGAH